MEQRGSSLLASPAESTKKLNSASIENTITMLALNDDCLLEVFQYLDLLELSAVADVCERFRQSAQDSFARSKKDKLDFYHDIYRPRDTFKKILLKTSRVLRNFGHFIAKLNVNGNLSILQLPEDQRKLFELFVRYYQEVNADDCSSLKEMDLSHFDLRIDFVHAMGPLRLRKLALRSSQIGGTFLSILPLWFGELQELRLDGVDVERFEFLHRSFPKLVTFALNWNSDLNIDDIGKMLQHNPQLKQIELGYLPQLENILPSIVEYVPEIETLDLCWYGTDTINRETIKDFAQLRAMRTLKLQVENSGDRSSRIPLREYIVQVIDAIAEANIPLKHLWWYSPCFELDANQFVYAIMKLKQLETLDLELCGDFTPSHLIEICRDCSELATFRSNGVFVPTPENIMEIVRYSPKLRLLQMNTYPVYIERDDCSIDIDMYKELLKIVKNRSSETHLEIRLPGFYNLENIPTELAQAHRRSLSIVHKSKI